MAMMDFDLLSNELIGEIFIHLERPDCLRVSLCCHLFRDVAEPFLYSTFVQTTKQDMALYLRTLIEKPYLAKYLKHFTGSMIVSDFYRGVEPGEFDLAAYLRDPIPRQWIRDQLPKSIFWPSRANSWHIHLCNNRYWDPICAFILWICSENLQSIQMLSYGSEVADWIDYLLHQVQTARKNPDIPDLFPKLRRVELRTHDPNSCMSLNCIFPYLKLDTVKEFVGVGIGNEILLGDASVLDDMVFQTESLVLQNSDIRSTRLTQFGLCFHSLKRLEYRHGDLSGTRMVRFWPSTARKGLQNSEHCLEELVLSASGQRWSPIPIRPEYLLALSNDFESLRMLDVSSRSMFGSEYQRSGTSLSRMLYDASWTEETYKQEYELPLLPRQTFASSLPPKLEHLIIRECTAAIYGFLEMMLCEDAQRANALKKLTVEFFPRFQPGEWTERGWYKEALRRGVEVEMIFLGAIGIIKALSSQREETTPG